VSINQIPKAPDIAFVPTMGALHDGHLALIKKARELSETVVVSIFVNPLQFDNPEDLAKYPRDVAGDSAKALAAGATHIWAPTFNEVYPEGAGDDAAIERLSAGHVGTLFEGASRPGHFDGMLTVVHRLFKAVAPRYAIFGEKDFQQLFLIRQLVHDLDLPITIVAAPLVREPDGLAMSSRNIRLDEAGRRSSLVISRALREASQATGFANQRGVLHQVLATEPGFTLDYAEIIDESNFQLATPDTGAARAIIAGWVNGVRLLDNMPMQVANS